MIIFNLKSFLLVLIYLVQDLIDKQEYAAKILLKSNPQKEKNNFLNEITILGILRSKT